MLESRLFDTFNGSKRNPKPALSTSVPLREVTPPFLSLPSSLTYITCLLQCTCNYLLPAAVREYQRYQRSENRRVVSIHFPFSLLLAPHRSFHLPDALKFLCQKWEREYLSSMGQRESCSLHVPMKLPVVCLFINLSNTPLVCNC